MNARLIHGHVLDELASLDAGTVQTCVTSPPYWGLRDYGTGGETWGGDVECGHEWGPLLPVRGRVSHGQGGSTLTDGHESWGNRKGAPTGQFCRKCGAWHGELGLEPTPELYVEHLVAVFRAVRRVLRDDGTLWLNLGDSYWGGKGESGSSKARATAKERGFTQSGGTVQMSKRPQDGKHSTLKPKDLVGIPWRVAFALQADGWWLRSDIIWSKPNPMPESVRDRPTRAHEYIFLLSKSAKYYYDADAINEPASTNSHGGGIKHAGRYSHQSGRNDGNSDFNVATPAGDGGKNRRSVWTITTAPFPEAHFATFPPKLPELCIKAGSAERACPKCGAPWVRVVERTKVFESGSGRSGNPICGKQDLRGSPTNSTPDIRMGPVVSSKTIGWRPTCDCGRGDTVGSLVLDPFIGSGTVGLVAEKLGRRWIGIDANEEYLEIARRRLAQPTLWTGSAEEL